MNFLSIDVLPHYTMYTHEVSQTQADPPCPLSLW